MASGHYSPQNGPYTRELVTPQTGAMLISYSFAALNRGALTHAQEVFRRGFKDFVLLTNHLEGSIILSLTTGKPPRSFPIPVEVCKDLVLFGIATKAMLPRATVQSNEMLAIALAEEEVEEPDVAVVLAEETGKEPDAEQPVNEPDLNDPYWFYGRGLADRVYAHVNRDRIGETGNSESQNVAINIPKIKYAGVADDGDVASEESEDDIDGEMNSQTETGSLPVDGNVATPLLPVSSSDSSSDDESEDEVEDSVAQAQHQPSQLLPLRVSLTHTDFLFDQANIV